MRLPPPTKMFASDVSVRCRCVVQREHAAHVEDPSVRATCPGAHERHTVLPSASEKVPGAHFAHSVDPSEACAGSAANVPGARGVVQCTTSSGAWIHVARDGVPDTKAYRRSQLDIDTSRKPSARSARKPSARKPAAKKPSKKKARK